MRKVCPDDEFLELYRKYGLHKTARILKVNIRSVSRRRVHLEEKLGVSISTPRKKTGPMPTRVENSYPVRQKMTIQDGVVLVGSDAHYWPEQREKTNPNYGKASAAHRAFVLMCKKLKPKAVIMNGDAFDGASISRHPSIAWEEKPAVIAELEECQKRMHEIASASGHAALVWTLGNHDQRFESRIAANAPEFAKVNGVHLRDHFPQWTPAWSIWINNKVVIKHRWHNGVHASYNNVLKSGKTIITGHLHSLQVRPYTDYTGTRFGVDTGTMADVHQDKEPIGKQFVSYTEDNPVNWRTGFIVLTFRNGHLMWPEIVHILAPDRAEFRGEIYKL